MGKQGCRFLDEVYSRCHLTHFSLMRLANRFYKMLGVLSQAYPNGGSSFQMVSYCQLKGDNSWDLLKHLLR